MSARNDLTQKMRGRGHHNWQGSAKITLYISVWQIELKTKENLQGHEAQGYTCQYKNLTLTLERIRENLLEPDRSVYGPGT